MMNCVLLLDVDFTTSCSLTVLTLIIMMALQNESAYYVLILEWIEPAIVVSINTDMLLDTFVSTNTMVLQSVYA